MSKPFDYSKWDNIELSDDEEDVHPNIDRESWFRMKHRSRVEREENEEKEKKRLCAEMDKANQRIKVLEHDLSKLSTAAKEDEDDDDDDDIDLDDCEGIRTEITALKKENEARQAKLDEFEKNKKWNVDNMFQVKEERTIINPGAPQRDFTPTGFAKPTTTGAATAELVQEKSDEKPKASSNESTKKPAKTTTTTSDKKPAAKPTTTAKSSSSEKKSTTPSTAPAPSGPDHSFGPEMERASMYSYHEFTERYADLVEEFMKLSDFEQSKEYLLKHGAILLQENASNYLLLASLEDEMNGYREKMRLTARQSQIISSVAELARSLKTHPGNVIVPFFQRIEQREFLDGFLKGVDDFVQKIIARAVVKKREIDAERAREAKARGEPIDLHSIPREERLGPGGLDPLEVIESLPKELQDAFESRDVNQLKEALLKLDPKEAEAHMKRCIDSGLWVAPGT